MHPTNMFHSITILNESFVTVGALEGFEPEVHSLYVSLEISRAVLLTIGTYSLIAFRHFPTNP